MFLCRVIITAVVYTYVATPTIALAPHERHTRAATTDTTGNAPPSSAPCAAWQRLHDGKCERKPECHFFAESGKY